MSDIRIGIASFAHMHAFGYASAVEQIPGAEIACIWDDDEERGRKMAERFQTRYERDLQRFLAEDMAGVVVTTPNAGHREVTVAAAEAGKLVLCEKPLSTTVADGQAMIDACKKAGVGLWTAFPCRFSPAMDRLRAVVADGSLGEIVAIAGTNRGSFPGGWFVELEKSGGGAVIDHTVHVVDLMRWLLGADVRNVFAEISSGMYHSYFDDCGLLSMEFDNGVFATLDTSWSRPKSFPFWGDVTMRITGTQGVAKLDMFNQKFTLHSNETMRTTYNAWGSNIDLGLMECFVKACRGEDAPELATGWDGLKALEVALGAYEANRQGRAVQLPLAG